jgi:hypothetical protein
MLEIRAAARGGLASRQLRSVCFNGFEKLTTPVGGAFGASRQPLAIRRFVGAAETRGAFATTGTIFVGHVDSGRVETGQQDG